MKCWQFTLPVWLLSDWFCENWIPRKQQQEYQESQKEEQWPATKKKKYMSKMEQEVVGATPRKKSRRTTGRRTAAIGALVVVVVAVVVFSCFSLLFVVECCWYCTHSVRTARPWMAQRNTMRCYPAWRGLDSAMRVSLAAAVQKCQLFDPKTMHLGKR